MQAHRYHGDLGLTVEFMKEWVRLFEVRLHSRFAQTPQWVNSRPATGELCLVMSSQASAAECGSSMRSFWSPLTTLYPVFLLLLRTRPETVNLSR
jgi:hypothetical protein